MDTTGYWNDAVRHFWDARRGGAVKQAEAHAGRRGEVVGGKHTDGFLFTLRDTLIRECKLPTSAVRLSKPLRGSPSVLPGFFRPTKNWDMVVSHMGELLAAIEIKAQLGPSFGNNTNNRAEEAIGNAQDLWIAFREGGYMTATAPFVGYIFLLEDHPRTKTPVAVEEPLYKVFPEFRGSSYLKRYQLLCERLVAERLYSGAVLLTANSASIDRDPNYDEPSTAACTERFLDGLLRRCMQV